jgi:hypothetical protein
MQRIQPIRDPVSETMIRIFLMVVAAGLVMLGIAVVYLGTYPPNPTPHPVEKVLPNDKFPSR